MGEEQIFEGQLEGENSGRLWRGADARAKARIWAKGKAQDTKLAPRKPSSTLLLAAFRSASPAKGASLLSLARAGRTEMGRRMEGREPRPKGRTRGGV